MTPKQSNHADLVAKYAHAPTPTVLELMRTALGSDIANGWTTVEQASQVVELLGLERGALILDLGAGRGWPGAHVAAACRGRLISTDLTIEAVEQARGHLSAAPALDGASALVANGVALPFRAAVFNAVVHADVLC